LYLYAGGRIKIFPLPPVLPAKVPLGQKHRSGIGLCATETVKLM